MGHHIVQEDMALWQVQRSAYQRMRALETSSSPYARVGPFSFCHGRCKSLHHLCSAQNGLCWDREGAGAGPPLLNALADQTEHKRTDLTAQVEVVAGDNPCCRRWNHLSAEHHSQVQLVDGTQDYC